MSWISLVVAVSRNGVSLRAHTKAALFANWCDGNCTTEQFGHRADVPISKCDNGALKF